jgi:uncharacterized membrane protein
MRTRQFDSPPAPIQRPRSILRETTVPLPVAASRPITAPRLVTAAATFVTGVSAGFFYAYADSVTRGLAAASDPTYVEAFQSINELVRTPLFMVVFAGPLILLAVAAVVSRRLRPARLLLIVALVCYTGVVVVTMAGNVPLNEQLATVTVTDPASLAAAREAFERHWNTLNLIRSVLAAAAFISAVGALAVLPGRTTPAR